MTNIVLLLGVLISTLGCSQPRRAERPICRPFVSVTFAYCARSLSEPVSPQAGCEAGCGCNGTGEEKSGDGLAVVSCRCPESCECKQAEEPPLVPVSPAPPPPEKTSRMECVNGQCYIVEPDGTRYRVIRRR